MSRFLNDCSAEHEEGASKNINLHGAVLHVIGDLVQSLGVAVAGALIWWKQVTLHCSAICVSLQTIEA